MFRRILHLLLLAISSIQQKTQASLITQTYPVNNVRAKDLAPVIDVFLKGDNIAGTKVFPFDGANILAVTASASQHKQLKEFFSFG
ncbi:secretin N-terminal domain-containing protein [Klebsiella pneumoniae]|uniref:secretin N-terminal domain-containing protein n=1 Tax=Klebsiella pneumoniae TaxID=573 RepID=UPI003975BD93